MTHYKLKVSGNKSQLVTRIYSFLYLSNYSIKIQKNIRGFLQRKYNKLQGPGFKNKNVCTNTTDFFTMDNLTELPNRQFFSFKDADGFIYGFNLLSIYIIYNLPICMLGGITVVCIILFYLGNFYALSY